MRISKHAEKRLKQRGGFNKKTHVRIAQRAFKEGVVLARTKGRLRKWMSRLYGYNKKADNIRLYGGMAYIFHDGVLVTVIQIPAYLMKDFKKMIK